MKSVNYHTSGVFIYTAGKQGVVHVNGRTYVIKDDNLSTKYNKSKKQKKASSKRSTKMDELMKQYYGKKQKKKKMSEDEIANNIQSLNAKSLKKNSKKQKNEQKNKVIHVNKILSAN